MADSNQDQDRDPRFSRALLGRIAAVGLFVGLGTFAVVQMMGGNENQPEQPIAQNSETNSEAGPGSPQSNVAGQSAPPKSSSIFDNTGAPPSAPPVKTAADSSGFNSSSKLGQNSFQPTPPPNTSANFEPGKSFEPVKVPPIANNSAFSTKPPTAPPNHSPPTTAPPTRYAQLPTSGVPVIGNDSGFGARPVAPNAEGSDSNFAAAKNKIEANVNQFGNKLGNTANQLLSDAKQGAGNVVENLQEAIPAINVAQPQLGNNPAIQKQPEPKGGITQPPALKRTFETPALPTGMPQNPNGNPPTMQAPVPNTAGFDSQRNLRPMDNQRMGNSFSDNSSVPANPNANQSRLRSYPAESNDARPDDSSESPSSSENPVNGPNKVNDNRGNTPNAQTKSGLPPFENSPPANSGGLRTPAQPVSSRIGSPTADPSPMSSPRTTNVPGDRQLEGVQAPSLTVEKLSPREIQVNQPAEFEIVVRNVGRVIAENVQVHDQIPAGTEFQGAAPEPTQVTPDRSILWQLGSLTAGQEKRIKFQLKPVQPGEIGSVAHVTFATQASMRTLVTKPVLEITHQTKPTVLIGNEVILDVVVANKGDGAARNVLIQEDVPQQLEYQGGYRELEYEIGTLLPGQSKRVQLGLKAAQIGRLKNLVFASAAGGLRASHEIDLEVIAPRLATSSDGPTRRFLQREVSHQFKIGNQGTAPATNVDLIARLPAGLRFVRADNQGRYDAGSHAVFWSLAELGMNVNATVELVTMPVDVGSQDIKFEAIADLNQKSVAQQELNVEHLIDVFFDIDDVVDPIEIGADTSYKIRVVNQGTQAATNVQLQVEFPNGLTPTGVEGSLQNQIQGQRIQFAPISSLKPGDQLDLLVRANGQTAGDHRVVLNMQADGRQTPVSKEETTRVYADR